MTFFLSPSTLADLNSVLESVASKGRGERLIIRNPIDRRCVTIYLAPEAEKLAVGIAIDGERHTIRLQARDPANAQHLREQIEAIANGTADTAETGAIGKPSAPQGLCVDDRNLIVLTSQKGGHAVLAMGAVITVHKHDLTHRTVIGAHNGETWLAGGSVKDVISSLRETLQQRLTA